MEIVVDRYLGHDQGKQSTLSKIYVDGEFVCYGLEDQYRPVKIKHKTRIWEGTYDVRVRTWGGFNSRYGRHASISKFHKGMLEIVGVDGFEDILIHRGNTIADTSGCLLVGTTPLNEKSDCPSIGNSAVAYKKFYTRVIDAALAASLKITFRDLDRSEKPAADFTVA